MERILFPVFIDLMKYFLTKPTVSGEFGPESVIDHTVIPRTISHVHFVFDHWPEDLVTSHPVFLASQRLTDALIENQCSGFTTEPCKVEKSVWFQESDREQGVNRDLPKFFRLMIGSDGKNDLMVIGMELIVSLKVKHLLDSFSCERVQFFPLNDIGLGGGPKFKFPDK